MAVSFHVNPSYARIDEVVPGLFISGVNGLDIQTIEENDISYIINATTEVPNLRRLSHLARHKLWLEDTDQTYIYPVLESQADQIASLLSEEHRVLVHCVAGVSRSASIVLAFLTKYRCKCLRDAYDLLAAKRPLVRPNLGFWRQLIAFEENTKGDVSSVHIVPVTGQESEFLPDVYLEEAKPSEETERRSPNGRSRFRPVLSTLTEIADAAA